LNEARITIAFDAAKATGHVDPSLFPNVRAGRPRPKPPGRRDSAGAVEARAAFFDGFTESRVEVPLPGREETWPWVCADDRADLGVARRRSTSRERTGTPSHACR